MSESNINPSPEALLAGIEAVAKAIGRNCTMDMYVAMARAEMLAAPPVPTVVADLSLRDRFAIAALPAVVASSFEGRIVAKEGFTTGAVMAEQAYHFADAMLAARGAA